MSALLLLTAPALLAAQQPAPPMPACRASLDGQDLTTTIEFPDGYSLEGAWRVLGNRSAALADGQPGVVFSVVLDRIIEQQVGARGKHATTPDKTIETTFEGHSEEELIYRAAQVWCMTVLKAQDVLSQPSQPARETPPRVIG